ncbi:dihydrolipoyllysine-residue acetyltransferase component of pyruvate dehydrogenase complex [Octadecabacter arcticus 238]|jgi:pyruvate dehydrogenase E2 component (dihydrolipoamide acetyltransferase)|uniref:Dihydrolipoamide acetyltransferase component of pyruvate dehydrogenase complex n=1 Tax=Octadecabacter arcticus 238 TaxID=391616 RepID=M9RR55_9RHOB|nr:dihydrolipoamide acetyltransferase family protein [Octadecabacter arcticus]AGI74218.1 dihydrolipoyllysine-residue acetyltransferase component of pyruvate dehydrogenase complex [Octadecabacter arcticus 238]
MPIEVILPKVDMDMSSGTIASWYKSEGEMVEEGEALFDIETDKATMEVESPGTGTLHFVSAKEGDIVPIGQSVAWLFAEGEEVVEPAGSGVSTADTVQAAAVESDTTEEPIVVGSPVFLSGTRATPLARRVAKKLNIDLQSVGGSGPRGRIVRSDVEKAAKSGTASPPPQTITVGGKTGAQKTADELGLAYTKVPVDRMRSIIAARLTESKSTVPHFYLNADLQIDKLLEMRVQINLALQNTDAKKISVNDLLVKACAAALKTVPEANASWDGDSIIKFDDAHISVAVSIDGGLITPVVRNAQKKDIQTISSEIADLAARAKTGKLGSKEYQGGSFSISNLGMFGVKSFNAIINPPESMILAVGQGAAQFVPDNEGNPKLATVMSVTLSCDHRVVDGALGAVWLKKFKELIENPTSLMLN